MSAIEQLNCFVIMPFGEKTDSDGRLINFDVIHRYIIVDAMKELKMLHNLDVECTRCDDIEKAGSIDTDMFNAILEADIAIVDITTGNPNVFYELGMRHALKENVTILIRQETDNLPFNIRGLRVINYKSSRVDSFDAAKRAIQRFVVNGLRKKCNDSPIREALPDLSVSIPRKPLRSGDAYLYPVTAHRDVAIGVLTGELEELRGRADIWVSSENTDLQLARYHDRSISGLIRYLGARKVRGRIVEDCIGDAVASETPRDAEGRCVPVNPGSVTPTGSGELNKTHGVKRIYHAATVQGTPGRGYKPVPNVTVCINTALSIADSEDEGRTNSDACRSILFPVFGSGVAGCRFRDSAKNLINAALNHVENHGSKLSKIYFLAHYRPELAACLDVLDEFARDGRLGPRDFGSD
jgi:O-acetyl-ADP-ribose deacetylase (regulator of RNase III)